MIRMDKNKTSFLLALLVGLFAFATADAQVYGGRGVGVNASVTTNGSTTNNVFADTGELPGAGGAVTATAPSSSVPGLLSTGVLTANSSGALKSSQSVTVANNVILTVGNYRILVDRVTSNSGCVCCPGSELGSCSGTASTNQFFVIDTNTGVETRIAGNEGPNQVVDLPGVGTITINEQIVEPGSITVNGLHLVATSGGSTYDVVVASSTSRLQCLSLLPSAGEVTLSGRVLNRRGTGVAKATVTATDGNGNVRTATTDSQGRYSIAGLDAGATYFVHATAKSQTFEVVTVSTDADVVVDLIAK